MSRILILFLFILLNFESQFVVANDQILKSKLNDLQGVVDENPRTEFGKVKKFSKVVSRMWELFELSKWGVGVTLGAGAIVGGTYELEAVQIEPGKLSFYCAPGVTMGTGVGVGATVSLIKVIRCEKSEDYTGNFFTLGITGGAALIGEMSYSYGANFDTFLTNLEAKKRYGQFRSREMIYEFPAFFQNLVSKQLPQSAKMLVKDLVCGGYQRAAYLGLVETSPEIIQECRSVMIFEEEENAVQGQLTLEFLEKRSDFFENHKMTIEEILNHFQMSEAEVLYPNISSFLSAWVGVFSGCDSIEIAGGIGGEINAAGAPVPLEVWSNVSHYKLAFEIDFREYMRVKNFSETVSEVFEDAEGMYEGIKSMAMFCPESVGYLSKDIGRFWDLMVDEPDLGIDYRKDQLINQFQNDF